MCVKTEKMCGDPATERETERKNIVCYSRPTADILHNFSELTGFIAY